MEVIDLAQFLPRNAASPDLTLLKPVSINSLQSKYLLLHISIDRWRTHVKITRFGTFDK